MRKSLLLLLAAAALGQDEGPAKNRLDEANRAAAEKVYRTVADPTYGITNRLRGLAKEDVVVVGGLFDFVQEILVAYRCPFTEISPTQLDKFSFNPERQILFLNCHLINDKFPQSNMAVQELTEEEAQRNLERVLKESGLTDETAPGNAIRKRFEEVKMFAGATYSMAALHRMGSFVQKGGWIFSTDWAILAVQAACPNTLQATGAKTFEETIEVTPSAFGRRSPLLEGAFEPGKPRARWWVEVESYLFDLKSPRARLLVESSQLAARYGGNRNVVAMVEEGKGRIVHALSHGYLQKGTAADMGVMQRLVVNLLMERSLMNWKRDQEQKEKAERKGG